MFKEIQGYEGLYSISEHGMVINSKNGKEIKSSKNSYPLVGLYKNGKRKNHRVHRLVAETFIPNPEHKPCVNHIDGNKLNNSISNLEWCTYNENELHSYRKLGKESNKPMKGKFGKNHSRSIPVVKLSMNNEILKRYESATEAAIDTGGMQAHITGVCKGKRRTCAGFKWMYEIELVNNGDR